MTTTFYARHADDRLNELLQEVISQLNVYTEGNIFDLEDNGLEDEAGNTICGIDDEYVYFEDYKENYPIEDLGLQDGIKLLLEFESLTPEKIKSQYITLDEENNPVSI